jgi:hypothetical protein
MRRIALLSVLFASISTLAGCGAHASSGAPAQTATYTASDCAPPPGGETEFSFEGSTRDARRANTAATSFKSNAVEKPKTGALHAANQ